MRAISLWEPWGSAIALGLKKIETRHWSTKYRGPLAIHCAKTREHADFIRDPLVAAFFHEVGIYRESQLAFGKVVAVCTLVDVVTTDVLATMAGEITAKEEAFGNYDLGRFGWKLANVKRLEQPFEHRGAQGFFNVPDELLPSVSSATAEVQKP